MAKFMKWIYVAFGSSLLILLFMSLNYYKRLERSNYYINSISHTTTTLLILEQLNGHMQQTANTFRNYLITHDSNFLNTAHRYMPLLAQKLDSLHQLTQDDKLQHKEVERIKSIIFLRNIVIDSITNRLKRSGTLDLNYFIQLEGLKETYETSYEKIREREYNLLNQRTENKEKFEAYTTTTLLLLIGFTALVVTVTFLYLVRSLKKRIYFERELREKISKLNMTNRELENLSRATSHHIQEPLRKIRSFASLLRTRNQNMDEAESNLLLQRIENNAGSLQTLAQNLVQYANLIQNVKKKELVNLKQLLKNTEDQLEDKIIEKKAKIIYGDLPNIHAVQDQVFILFCELITNSLKFSKKDQPPEIVIEANRQKEKVTTITVKDTGEGFSDEYAERIFRLFEQLDPGTAAGKGVGLPMCERIMANHNGSISARGKSGEGAVFTLEFPDQV